MLLDVNTITVGLLKALKGAFRRGWGEVSITQK